METQGTFPIVSQMNPVHILTLYYFTIYFSNNEQQKKVIFNIHVISKL